MPIERDDLGTRIIGNGVRGIQFYDDNRVLRHEIYLDRANDLHISSSTVSSTTLVTQIAYVTTNTVQDLIVTGTLTFGLSGSGLWQGTGTFEAPDTGLKIWNHDGIGLIAGFNAGVPQWYADTDGKLYAGARAVMLDEDGMTMTAAAGPWDPQAIKFLDGSGNAVGSIYLNTTTYPNEFFFEAQEGTKDAYLVVQNQSYVSNSWSRTMLSAKYGSVQGYIQVTANECTIPAETTASVTFYVGGADIQRFAFTGGYVAMPSLSVNESSPTVSEGSVFVNGVSGDTTEPLVILALDSSAEWTLGVDDSDGDAFKINAGGSLADVSSLMLTSGPKLLLNETSDANLTIGLVINQGGNDDACISLKSSDVNHPFTATAESDTYGQWFKTQAASGGLMIRGYKSSADDPGGALVLNGRLGEAADTTSSTAATGVVNIVAHVTDGGTGQTTVAAAGNVLAVRNGADARLIVKGNGDLWVGGKLVMAAGAQDYTVSNLTTDRSYDADSTSTAELADVLGTLITDLIAIGLLQ